MVDRLLLIFALLLVVLTGYSKELDYSIPHCRDVLGGQAEYILPDRTRVDCLTDEVAWEYGFGNKWYEDIGQALYYAMWAGREGGVVLILTPDEMRFYDRAKRTVKHYGLPIRVIWIPK